MEIKPTIHLGEKAAALERKVIHTERGEHNREVRYLNSLIVKVAEFRKEHFGKLIGGIQKGAEATTNTVKNEVLEFIHLAAAKKGIMSAP